MKNMIIGAIQNARPDKVSLIDGARYELITKQNVIKIINDVAEISNIMKRNGTQL